MNTSSIKSTHAPQSFSFVFLMFYYCVLPLALALPGVLAAHVDKRTLNAAAPSPWVDQGCFIDECSNRILANASYTDVNSLTIEKCIAFCDSKKLEYCGLEYGSECYGGNSLKATARNVTECNMKCSGNTGESCGAGNRIRVYMKSASPPDNWKPQGCYKDSIGSRTLPQGTTIDGGMTAEKCTTACQAKGSTLAGLEYSKECWCGNSINESFAVTEGCDMACSGDPSQICGGGNRLTVFKYQPASVNVSTACVETYTKTDLIEA
ncbi:WSC domain-containing protein, partial [Mycena leptocephala]